ncbi:MAG: hypothetical protein GY745_11300 [Actinomycetia bacterium]|nr:hypothetical protein [Actinomycetes bacterium]MCP4085625.1 hypothetical protein [Actinomycetes bacterium]
MKTPPIIPFLPSAPPGAESGQSAPRFDPGFAETLDRHRQMPGPSRPVAAESHRSVEPHRAERRPEPERSREANHRPEPERSGRPERRDRPETAERSEVEDRNTVDRLDDTDGGQDGPGEADTEVTTEDGEATDTTERPAEGDQAVELALGTNPAMLSALVAAGAEQNGESRGDLEVAAEPAVDPSLEEVEVGDEQVIDGDGLVLDGGNRATTDLTADAEATLATEAAQASPPAGATKPGDKATPLDGSVPEADPDAQVVAGPTIDLTADALAAEAETDPTAPTLVAGINRPLERGPASSPAGPSVVAPVVASTTTTVGAASVATAVPGATAASAATGTTAWEQVSASIASTVRTLQDGSHRLLLRLHPEELGSVVLELTVSGERVDVRLLAQQVGTRDLLNQTADELRQDLGQNGLSLGSMDVDLERGPESDSADEETTTSGSAGSGDGAGSVSGRSGLPQSGVRRSDSSLDLDL